MERWADLAFRESALAQYLVSQLKLTPAKLAAPLLTHNVPVPASELRAPSPSRPALAQATAVVDAVAAEFFARVMPHVSGKLVIVVDADRQALMNHGGSADPPRQRFIALARAAGAVVIDTEDLFKAHYAHSSLSLDLSPRDAHFNPLGVRLLASAMADALRE